MATNNYSFPTDAFPVEIVEAYQSLQEDLNFWLSPHYGTLRVVAYFDESLERCRSAVQRINYICWLAGVGGEEPGLLLAAGMMTEASFKESYLVWLAVRLTETLCIYIGNSRLRSGRGILEENWLAIKQNGIPQSEDNPLATELVQFLFRVLIPFARGASQPQRIIDALEKPVVEIMSVAKDGQNSKSKKTPVALVHTLESLCRVPFTPSDLRELLTHLQVLDSETGYWHLGELKGKAASPLSAFPAAYRAAQEANLMLLTDAPVYRKLFTREYRVDFKDRLANFKDGSPSASAAFHEYLNKARQWIKMWKTKQQIFMRAV